MKKIILVLSIVFTSIIVNAQQAPKAVKENFAKKFPTAKSVKWEKENDKEYEASFTVDGTKHSANFTNDGTWVETESEIKIANLPQAVTAAISSKYAGYKVVDASKIETATTVKYEADIKKGKIKKEVLFAEDGTFIK